ncbi:MAG: LysM domain-containing protein, partial [Pseudomonadota bacterium]
MRSKRFIRMTGLTLGPAVLLMGCDPQPSLDRFSAPTSSGAEAIVNSGARPQPDANGIIRYPTYQVAVAEPGDTVASMAGRLGLEPATLARFNGLSADADLRAGEVVVLPEGVEPTIAGPDIETSGVDIRAQNVWDIGDNEFSLGLDMTYVIEYVVGDLDIDGVTIAGGDRVDQFNRSNFSRSLPQWKANITANYAVGDHNFRGVVRHIDSYDDE